MKKAISLTIAAIALTIATPLAVAVTLAETGEPIGLGDRPAYCRGEVSGKYGTQPQYVKTLPVVIADDDSSTIGGTVDKGAKGIQTFKCRFDAAGRFIDVMATDE